MKIKVGSLTMDEESIRYNSTGSGPQEPEPEDETNDDANPGAQERALIAANGAEAAAINFLTNTLATLSDSQKSIINSQAANRELLGVLIQDNFNLKEENNRLRERILEVERDLSQTRQEEEWRREALRQELDARIGAVQQLATQAMITAQTVEAPELKAVKSKSGCLGALFGGGDTQIVAIPRRRSREAATASSAPPVPAPSPSQPSASYPRPTFPPE